MNKHGYNRPDPRLRQRGSTRFWILALVVVIVAAIGGAAVGYWVFKNVNARLVLRNQPATVTIPDPIYAIADVLNKLDITLDNTIHTKVPVDQTVSIPVNDTLKLLATFDAKVPIKLEVNVNQSIPVDQTVHVDAVVEAKVFGETLKLPIRGDIPIKAVIPLHLTIPIDKKVRLQFTAPIKAKLKQNLTVPLKTVIDADVPISADLSVPVKNALKARVYLPDTPTPIIINYADLTLPLRTLKLGLKGDDNDNQQGKSKTPDAQ